MATPPLGGLVSLFAAPVRHLLRREPVTCDAATPVAEAAARMDAAGVGSIVVVDDGGAPIGIMTDRDLRGRVVAARCGPDEPVGRLMSRPVATIAADEPAVEALLLMLRRNFHHLPVMSPAADGGTVRLLGVVSAYDFLAVPQLHPLRLLRTIEDQRDLQGLAAVARHVDEVARSLYEEGVPARHLCRVITELNDAVTRRVLQLVEAAVAGDAPAPRGWCWLALGSEGRREQTLRTDQDNALVYAGDGAPDAAGEPDGSGFMGRLAAEAARWLEACGFPPCRAGIMASNPGWRRSEAAWLAEFRRALAEPYGDRLVSATALLDARPLWGDVGLGHRLLRRIAAEARGSAAFLRRLAEEATSIPAPLSPWGVRTPWRGPLRGRVSIKRQALGPFTACIRVWAVRHGVAATNTLERIEAVAASEREPAAARAREDLVAAYEGLLRLRIGQELKQREAPPAPAGSSELDVRALPQSKQAELVTALRALRLLQEELRQTFML